MSDTQAHNLALAEALAVAGWGWPVFPCYGIVDGVCTCRKGPRCGTPGKHPLITDNLNAATTDRQQILAWAKRWPGCNWAMATGKRSGIVGLDIDPRHGGDVTLRALVAEHGPLPLTARVRTGAGGDHYHMQDPGVPVKSRAHALGRGVDVKGDGGYLMLPGCRHIEGDYAWVVHPEQHPPAPLPEWILQRVHRDVEGIDAKTHRRIDGKTVRQLDRKTDTAIRDFAALFQSTLPQWHGQRNRKLLDLARLARFHPDLANASNDTLKALVRRWHKQALPFIATKDFDTSWADFLYALERVHTPLGQGQLETIMQDIPSQIPDAMLPPPAREYETPEVRRLVVLCRELQRASGAEPFYLSANTAAMLLGLPATDAERKRVGRWLATLLTHDGILRIVKPGTARTATFYRYIAEGDGR